MAIDIDKLVNKIHDIALPPFGQRKCALHVRLALEAAGASTAGHPVAAKDWGDTLVRAGFRALGEDSSHAVKGDIAVIQSTSNSASGHIQVFDGTHWVSDFVQPNGFWPGPTYRSEKPSFVIYRP